MGVGVVVSLTTIYKMLDCPLRCPRVSLPLTFFRWAHSSISCVMYNKSHSFFCVVFPWIISCLPFLHHFLVAVFFFGMHGTVVNPGHG